jgi:hypothetical protein
VNRSPVILALALLLIDLGSGCAGVAARPDGGGGSASGGSTATGGSAGGQAGADTAADGQSPPADAAGKLAEPCEGDPKLTGQEVVDAVKYFPEAKGKFGRFVYPPGPPALGQETPLTIRVRYQGGDVICNQPGANQKNGVGNPNSNRATVDVVLQVDFVTGDGLFNETFALPFQLNGNDVLFFNGTVPVSSIKGTYRAIAEADAAGPDTPITFYGLLYLFMHESSYGGVVHGQAFGHFEID